MRKPTPDQWMGGILAAMAVTLLVLSIFDVGVGGERLRAKEGDPMLPIQVRSLEGDPVVYTAGDSKGQVLLLDFWATWCPPCVAEMPILAAIHEAHADDSGVRLLSINGDTAASTEAQARLVRRFLKERGLDVPIVLDDGRTQSTWGIQSYPTLVVVGADGRIAKIFHGLTNRAVLESAIEKARARAGS